MEKGNPNDPLFLQVMASQHEFLPMVGFTKDPLEEQHNSVPNILHKYHNRLLLIVKNSCAVNCRYCFRRHFPYAENKGNKQSWAKSLDYIAAHAEIEEVIFFGGDPLMAKDHELAWLIKELENIPHLHTLRIHTRLPVVIPQRITDELCRILSESRFQKVIVTHINHPNEIDEILACAINKLKHANVTLLNQSVVLKNINDNAHILKKLSDKLFSIGILPYYLHLLDKVEEQVIFILMMKVRSLFTKNYNALVRAISYRNLLVKLLMSRIKRCIRHRKKNEDPLKYIKFLPHFMCFFKHNFLTHQGTIMTAEQNKIDTSRQASIQKRIGA